MADYEINQNNAPQWSEWATNFDKAYKLFSDNYAGLQAQYSFVANKPELKAKYDVLMADAKKHAETLEKLKKTRDSVVNFMSKVGEGLVPNKDDPWYAVPVMYGLDDLGFIPAVIVGISVVSASAALVAISAWIKDAYTFSQVLNETRRLEDKGMSPVEAAKLAQSAIQKSTLFGVSNSTIKLVAIAAIALVLLPPVLDMIEKRR